MTDIENRVIGGPHHREYHDCPDVNYIRLPIRQPLALPTSEPENLPDAVTTIQVHGYRRHYFYDNTSGVTYGVWIPDNVPEGKTMAHVLGLALRAPKP